MLKIALILVLFLFNYSFSQKLIWEKELEFEFKITSESTPSIIDNNANIISLVEKSSSERIFSYFLRYSPEGELLTFKNNYFIPPRLFVHLNFIEKENGFQLLAGTSNKPSWTFNNKLLPMIIKFDTLGNITDTVFPYDIYDKNNYNNNFIKRDFFTNNTLSLNDQYFNLFVNDKIKLDSLKYSYIDHIIFTALDNNGKILYQRGYDTLSGTQFHYNLHDFIVSNNQTLISLLHYFKMDGIDLVDTKIMIYEIDTIGNIINKMVLSENNNIIIPEKIIQAPSGNYFILGQYINISNNEYFVWEIDTSGAIINKKRIAHKYIKNDFHDIYIRDDQNIFLIGRVLFDEKDPQEIMDDMYRYYIYNMDLDFNFIWDFEWFEDNYGYSSKIYDLLFLNNKEAIIIGNKNAKNYYIAKLSTDKVENTNDNDLTNFNVNTFPNPIFNNQLINISIILPTASKIKLTLYNSLGIKISEIFNGFKEPGDHTIQFNPPQTLPSGAYYIKMQINGQSQITKPIIIMR